MTVVLHSPAYGKEAGEEYSGPEEAWLVAQGYARSAGGSRQDHTLGTAQFPSDDPTLAENREDTDAEVPDDVEFKSNFDAEPVTGDFTDHDEYLESIGRLDNEGGAGASPDLEVRGKDDDKQEPKGDPVEAGDDGATGTDESFTADATTPTPTRKTRQGGKRAEGNRSHAVGSEDKKDEKGDQAKSKKASD